MVRDVEIQRFKGLEVQMIKDVEVMRFRGLEV